MKLEITKDEAYPVFSFQPAGNVWPGQNAVEVDYDTYQRWRATIAAYQLVQAELRQAFDVDRIPSR